MEPRMLELTAERDRALGEQEAFGRQAGHVADQLIALLSQYPEIVMRADPVAGAALVAAIQALGTIAGREPVSLPHVASRLSTR